MRITPLDVRKQEFRRAVRGFDCDEVRAFLNTLADEYETVLIDNKQLRDRALEQGEKIEEYKHLERTLRDTLMTAERLMQDTRERATKEGDLIIQDARLQAKRVLEECRVRTEELRGELTGLRKEKETYLARFRTLAETQIQFVESHRSDFDDLDKRLVGMVDEVIEGLGAKAAASAEAAVEQHATTSWPTREQAPEPEAVEAPAAYEPPVESVSTPEPDTYGPAVADEVDQWRDYQPAATTTAPAPEPAAAPTPVESAPAESAPIESAPVELAPEPETTAPEPWAMDVPAAETPAAETPAPEATHEAVRPEIVVAPAPPSAPAQVNPWQSGQWTGKDDRAEPAPAAAVADVKLAALGIPVALEGHADGTDKAVAALSEEPEPEPTSVW